MVSRVKILLHSFAFAWLTTDAHAKVKLYGINYSVRSGPDWAPLNEKCKSVEAITADLENLKGYTDRIKLYSISDCDQAKTIMPIAASIGLTVSLGLWVSNDPSVFENEKNGLISLINSKIITAANIDAIYVGSEAVYRKDVSAEENIKLMREIKKICVSLGLESVSVTIAEIGDIYLQYRQLIGAVDFIALNGFPFWEKIDVNVAVQYFNDRTKPLYDLAKSGGVDVVIGETGWPSNGTHVNTSIASPINAATYFRDFYNLATMNRMKFYYFEAYDAKWKLTQDPKTTVEGYFGLFTSDRLLKPEIEKVQLALSNEAKSNNPPNFSTQQQETAAAPRSKDLNQDSSSRSLANDEFADSSAIVLSTETQSTPSGLPVSGKKSAQTIACRAK